MKRASKVLSLILLAQCFVMLEVVAEELESLRLFHEPLIMKAIVVQSDQSPVLPDDAPALPEISYRYNGFMSSDAGRQYIVNGINLSELGTLDLLLVSNFGRTLKLRTGNGYVFTIAIGETVSIALKLTKRNNE